ncbi:MAG: ribose 5-phosphate isomerase B [Candidatus Omnitrophica bacterium]|nr:ribose 5-phosphate isomerase B [Candidatus Omnitrophota bacterium]
MVKKIAIGSDHGGFRLKEKIKTELDSMGIKIMDEGPGTEDSCDYPLFGFGVAEKVALRKADRGIVICTSGIGMSIVANKLPGVRAALCATVEDAVSSREHNDANVLVLGAKRVTGPGAVRIAKVWLATKALKGRHARRVRQIKEIDKRVFKKMK